MRREDWIVDVVDDVTIVRSAVLGSLPGLVHGFSTRRGPGGAVFDLSDAAGDEARARRRLLCRAVGLATADVTSVRQVHGAEIVRADRAAAGRTSGDGILALRADRRTPAVRWADCVPILMADRSASVVAAVHAGWRGVAAGVVDRAVSAMRAWGAAPHALVVALGPAIGSCCYEVGPEVSRAIARATATDPAEFTTTSESGQRLDLRRAIEIQLAHAGLPDAAIHAAPWCTACSEELFFSHRGSGGRPERQLACVGWRD